MRFLNKKKKEFYVVNLQNFIVRREFKGLNNKNIIKIKCPKCGVCLDNIKLYSDCKCFLCGLEMKRVELFKLKCYK